ncbi:hypothetical protein NDU88_001073 [Pleurodeles waltl]|uniref:Uncharacterized protein n=1 Tax=Pleurodeles waltl TaxID=8319 RepID=A0AAV7R5Z9_PLEWA|nr:hypothetical protein NDU88_001073 [Pleurodeles waltl]
MAGGPGEGGGSEASGGGWRLPLVSCRRSLLLPALRPLSGPAPRTGKALGPGKRGPNQPWDRSSATAGRQLGAERTKAAERGAGGGGSTQAGTAGLARLRSPPLRLPSSFHYCESKREDRERHRAGSNRHRTPASLPLFNRGTVRFGSLWFRTEAENQKSAGRGQDHCTYARGCTALFLTHRRAFNCTIPRALFI